MFRIDAHTIKWVSGLKFSIVIFMAGVLIMGWHSVTKSLVVAGLMTKAGSVQKLVGFRLSEPTRT